MQLCYACKTGLIRGISPNTANSCKERVGRETAQVKAN